MLILFLDPCVQDAFFFFFFYALFAKVIALTVTMETFLNKLLGVQLGIPFLVIYPFLAGVPPSSHPLQRLGRMDILERHRPNKRDNETGI